MFMAALDGGTPLAGVSIEDPKPDTLPQKRKPLKRARRKRYVKAVLGYRAQQVYSFVLQTIDRTGEAPSYATICDALGIGTKGEVSDIVKSLEAKGLLSRVGKGRVRSGKTWNKPRISTALKTAFPLPK